MTPKRQVPRVIRALTFWIDGGRLGTVVDVSALGLRIECRERMEPGATLSGELRVRQGQVIPLEGEVIWCRRRAKEGYTLGVALSRPPKAYFDAVAELFAQD